MCRTNMILCVLLAALFSWSLVGCGGDDTSTTAKGDKGSTQENASLDQSADVPVVPPDPEPYRPAPNRDVSSESSDVEQPGASTQSQPATSPSSQQPVTQDDVMRAITGSASPADSDQNDTPMVEAHVGMGEQGRGIAPGIYGTPIRAYFSTRETLALNMIKKNMDLFKAMNGRPPKSHKEFMTEIIKNGGVTLPRLPSGEEYYYDPQKAELMVRKKQ